MNKIARVFGRLDIGMNISEVEAGRMSLTNFTVETLVDGGMYGFAFGIGWDLGAEYGPIQYYMKHKR